MEIKVMIKTILKSIKLEQYHIVTSTMLLNPNIIQRPNNLGNSEVRNNGHFQILPLYNKF